MPDPTRAIGYVRISKDSLTGTSPLRQRERIERYVEASGWTLVGVEEDIDVSATRTGLNRPGLNRVRKAVAEGRADIVVITALDRIARKVSDMSQLVAEGVKLASLHEKIDQTTPTGIAMMQVTSVFAQLEAATIGSRVKSMRDHLPRVGRWPGGPTPYGHTTAPVDGGAGRTLVHDPDEAVVVRRLISGALEGKSFHQLAVDLTSDGIRTRRGNVWSAATVAVTLRNGSLRGWATVNRDYLRDERGIPAVVWPPYLTPEEARALDKALERKTSRVRYSEGAVALLHGLAICSSCGRALTPRHFARPDLAALYACHSRNRGFVCELPQTIIAHAAEEEAEAQFLARWGHTPIIETVAAEEEPEGLAEIVNAIRDTQEKFGRPGADYAALAARMQTLDAERQRLAALPKSVAVQRATGQTYGEKWKDATTAERRELMLSAEAYVFVYPPVKRGGSPRGRIRVMDELAGALDE